MDALSQAFNELLDAIYDIKDAEERRQIVDALKRYSDLRHEHTLKLIDIANGKRDAL